MKTLTLPGGPTIRYYTDLDEFPAERRSYLTRYQIEASEIDTTPDALAERMGMIIRMYRSGNTQHGELALQNLLYSFQAAKEHYAPDSLSFGVLIHDVDGVVVSDLSPEGLKPLLDKLAVPVGIYTAIVAEVKKNSQIRETAISLGLKMMA